MKFPRVEIRLPPTEETDDEEKPFQRRIDHWHIEGSSSWAGGQGIEPLARDQRCDLLQVVVEIRRDGSVCRPEAERF